MPHIALLQMNGGIDPAANAAVVARAIADAAADGAAMLFTPEMTNLVDRDRARARNNIVSEEADRVLAAGRDAAARAGIWVHLGSLAIDRGDGRLANRGFVIGPDGAIVARYDKIHLFDVALASGESWRESAAYAGGDTVVTVEGTPLGRLGLAICYDLRFPALFARLGAARCDAIAVPSAFTVPTGEAHWHLMLRARAVEATAFVIAAAQAGSHADGRRTYGHSLVAGPWGELLHDQGEAPGLASLDLDLAAVESVRRQLPVLENRRDIADIKLS